MLKITLDPGHTKNYNKGAISGYYEGNAMFTLAGFLKEELLKYEDVDVFLTRNKDENPTLEERGKFAINNESSVFISLHSNAVSGILSAWYVCGFYSVKRPNSKVLCDKLTNAVTSVMKEAKAKNKGALTKKTQGVDYYGVIRSSVAGNSPVEHSFIIEHGFHSTKQQCEFLMKDENLKQIAKAEAEVLAEYFGLKVKETPKQIIETGDIRYRVQVDTFSTQESAQELVKKLKEAGFSGYITIPADISTPSKTLEQVARDVVAGKYGSGHATREKRLAEVGWLDYYTYEKIRNKVNELCKK